MPPVGPDKAALTSPGPEHVTDNPPCKGMGQDSQTGVSVSRAYAGVHEGAVRNVKGAILFFGTVLLVMCPTPSWRSGLYLVIAPSDLSNSGVKPDIQ